MLLSLFTHGHSMMYPGLHSRALDAEPSTCRPGSSGGSGGALCAREKQLFRCSCLCQISFDRSVLCLSSPEGSVLCVQGSSSCAVQPLLPVSLLHPRSVLLYAVLQRLRGESCTPPGLLKLLARHREYMITPHSCPGQARAL